MSITYPYNDEFMIFDEISRRYVLTEACAQNRLGLELGERVNERNAVNQQAALKRVFRQVSNTVYNFIHEYNFRADLQDLIVEKVPSARAVIQDAMEEQLLYMSMKGDLSRSTDKDKRELAVDENAKAVLGRILPEIGISLLYTGDLRRIAACLC